MGPGQEERKEGKKIRDWGKKRRPSWSTPGGEKKKKGNQLQPEYYQEGRKKMKVIKGGE